MSCMSRFGEKEDVVEGRWVGESGNRLLGTAFSFERLC